MPEIIWTTEAADCLEEIHEYIARDNATAAHKVVTGIYEKIQMLRRQPRIGQRYEGIGDREVREILYGHYRINRLSHQDRDARRSARHLSRRNRHRTPPQVIDVSHA